MKENICFYDNSDKLNLLRNFVRITKLFEMKKLDFLVQIIQYIYIFAALTRLLYFTIMVKTRVLVNVLQIVENNKYNVWSISL